MFIGVGVGLAVYLLVSLIQLGVYVYKYTHPEPEIIEEEEPMVSLPTKCRPYLGDGTDRWINCMGVGKK